MSAKDGDKLLLICRFPHAIGLRLILCLLMAGSIPGVRASGSIIYVDVDAMGGKNGISFTDNPIALAYQSYLPIIHKSSIIYVDADASGANDGTSWADAYTSLQAAFESAAANDRIWVAAGTYYPSVEACGTGSDRNKTFQLKNGVAVYGGFDPSIGAVGWEDRDWVVNPTILSGDIGIAGDNRDNSYHVFCHPEGLILDSRAILDGFVIQDGNADSFDFRQGSGGGMTNYDTSSPTLSNLTFSNNSAYAGGGMANSGSPALTNVTFSYNSATDSGGGMVNVFSSSMTNVTFTHNSAVMFGGGLYQSFGSPTLDNVTFSDNSAGSYGGGMFNSESSTAMLTNVTFSNNSSGWDGGGMFNDGSFPTLVNVTFSGNTSVYGGGGMYNGSGAPTLVNVTFSGNTAVAGGGMYNNYSSTTLANVTFSGNTAVNGGGIYNTNSELTLTNGILWGDAADEIFDDNSITVVTYSDIQGGYGGEGNIDADPRLSILADNGGFVLTHALGTGSPAIDAGDPDPATCPATDARGEPRPVDGDEDDVPRCDMGAYEFQLVPFPDISLPLVK